MADYLPVYTERKGQNKTKSMIVDTLDAIGCTQSRHAVLRYCGYNPCSKVRGQRQSGRRRVRRDVTIGGRCRSTEADGSPRRHG